jgi:hypothetical protein
MDVLPALRPLKLQDAEPGNLCARVSGSRLILGMILQNKGQKYWVPFEGNEPLVLEPAREREPNEAILNIQGARFYVQLAKTGVGNCYDPALAGSVFVIDNALAICVIDPDLRRGRAFAVKDGSYIQIPEGTSECPFFSSWEIEVPSGDGKWRSIFDRNVDR